MINRHIKFLPSNYKKKSFLFFLLLIIATILETFSIGLVFPLLEMIFKEDLSKTVFIFDINSFFLIENKNQFIRSFSIFLILLYFGKSIYLVYFTYWQQKFSQNVFKFLSCNIFERYLKNPLNFFYNKNSSELIRNTMIECNKYGQYISIFFQLTVEITVAIFILIFLIYIEPFKTLIILFFAVLISTIYYLFTRKVIYKYGASKLKYNGKQIKTLNESFSGIKDIKLKLAESFFLKLYEKYTNKSIEATYKQNTIVVAPKFLFEFLFVFGILVSLIFMIRTEVDLNNIIPIFSLYIITGYRLIPCVMRIMNFLQQMKGLKPTIEILEKELIANNKKISVDQYIKDFQFINEIKISNINFSYQKNKSQIRNFSSSIKKNTCVGIIGKSGSGKSTLIDLITGMISPDKGEILVDSKNIFSNLKGWQKKIGYVSQNVFLLDNTIKNNVAFGVDEKNIDLDNVKKSLKNAELENFISQLKDGLETVVGEKGVKISGGQKQRLAIARELYRKPEILIMDEATSGLDEVTENQIMEFLENVKNKLTVIIVSHRKNTLKNCDQIINL